MVQGEPPGTPPPPYGYLPADEADENYSVIIDDVSMMRQLDVVVRFLYVDVCCHNLRTRIAVSESVWHMFV